MTTLRDILILIFLLGSAMCFGSTVPDQTHDYTNNHQPILSGLDMILKTVPTPESIGNSGYAYSKGEYSVPTHHQGSGYQYMAPNTGGGYKYENPLEVQKVVGLEYGTNHLNNNKNPVYGSVYQSSGEHKVSRPFKEFQGQSPNLGYHYDPPAETQYGNLKAVSKELDFSYDTPKQSFNTNLNFKGEPYLPGLSSSQNNYKYDQKQVFQGQVYTTANNGYQYENPKHSGSGYNYYRPQSTSGRIESNFKGQSYLPNALTSSYLTENTSQGYFYEKPSTTFQEESYLPSSTKSSGW